MGFVATNHFTRGRDFRVFFLLKIKDPQPTRCNELYCKKTSLRLLGDVPCENQVSDYFDVKQPDLKEVQIKRSLL